jgi:hypothetical protein
LQNCRIAELQKGLQEGLSEGWIEGAIAGSSGFMWDNAIKE